MLGMFTLARISSIYIASFIQLGSVLLLMTLAEHDVFLSGFGFLIPPLVFIASIVIASLINERTSSDRFWRIYFFSCFAGFVPSYAALIVRLLSDDIDTYAGLTFVLIAVTALLSIGGFCALPFVGLLYWWRGRNLPRP